MLLAPRLKQLVMTAAAAYSRASTPALRAASKAVMADCEAAATTVLVAARHLLGPEFLGWEPESLWIELAPCEANKDKLLAAISLDLNPCFYWDARVFAATIQAFNNTVVHHDTVPHLSAAFLAWGVYEAELIFALLDGAGTLPEFMEESAGFTAASLLHEGVVVPPEGTGFCEEALLGLLNPEAKQLHDRVKEAWREQAKNALDEAAFEDSAFGVQMARQADVYLYLVNRADSLLKALSYF